MRSFSHVKRIVVKIGSNLLAPEGGIDRERMDAVVEDIAVLAGLGYQVLLVSSGAVALGAASLCHRGPVTTVSLRQASAAIGQPLLMSEYRASFKKHNIQTAQVLITRSILNSRTGYNNLRSTVSLLLALSVVPIFNENDAVSSTGVKALDVFGDNDRLSAMIASKVDADLLILLTDIDALYTGDPKKDKNARRISEISEINDEILSYAGSSGSMYSKGGMKTKLLAAGIAKKGGCATVIASGYESKILQRVVSGEDVGTFIHPEERMAQRERWIANTGESGAIIVDRGAKEALLKHKSLLPPGIIGVRGSFERSEVVLVLDEEGKAFAKAVPYFDSSEIERIMGHRSGDIDMILGSGRKDVVFRPEDIVFLD